MKYDSKLARRLIVWYLMLLFLMFFGWFVISPLCLKGVLNAMGYDAVGLAHKLAMSIIPYTVIVMLLATIVYYLMSKRVTSSVNEILNIARDISNHDYVTKPETNLNAEFQDIYTALVYISHDLSKQTSEQQKFISNISHDFRSPLTSINGYVGAMLDGTIPPENYDKYLKIVKQETERLTKLSNQLLNLDTLQMTELNITTFDINEVIRSTIDIFSNQATDRLITLKPDFSDEKLFVSADQDSIMLVLQNLIDNALKFSHDNSTVTIKTTSDRYKACITVMDCGIGISKDEIHDIWKRFYKTDASRGKDKKGTGLGLSIVKEAIEAHNEQITVASTLNIGSEFSFTLPIKSV